MIRHLIHVCAVDIQHYWYFILHTNIMQNISAILVHFCNVQSTKALPCCFVVECWFTVFKTLYYIVKLLLILHCWGHCVSVFMLGDRCSHGWCWTMYEVFWLWLGRAMNCCAELHVGEKVAFRSQIIKYIQHLLWELKLPFACFLSTFQISESDLGKKTCSNATERCSVKAVLVCGSVCFFISQQCRL